MPESQGSSRTSVNGSGSPYASASESVDLKRDTTIATVRQDADIDHDNDDATPKFRSDEEVGVKAGAEEAEEDSQLGKGKEKERPYSVFTRKEKWCIVSLIALAGVFSPFTANIYFPAIPTIASAFHKSTELINLTVTMYMVLQGLSPMVFGSIADTYGRRPVFILCLAVLCISCVGLALVPTNAYWLLMVLRCVQASGGASTIALGAGVMGDVAVPAERGGFMGAYSLGPLLGPALGPVVGGALSNGLGWRSIFWFLCIASGIACGMMVLFLPETLRTLVGDGSIIPLQGLSIIYKPLIPFIGRHARAVSTPSFLSSPDIESNPSNPKQPHPPMPIPKKKFKNPLLLLKNLDILLLLIFNGIVYAVFYAVTASISSLFSEIYPFLNDTTIGLCFLTIGLGAGVGSAVTGKMLDWDFRRVAREIKEKEERVRGGGEGSDEQEKEAGEKEKEKQELEVRNLKPGDVGESFPLEKARLRLMPYFMAILVTAGMGYGWCLQKKVNLAGPLALQFIIGWLSVSVMNPTQTLIVDLMPGQGSSVTACNNLVRCALGALSVSVIDLLLKRLGPGWTYVLLNAIIVLFMPLLWLVMKLGPIYRKRRREAEKRTLISES